MNETTESVELVPVSSVRIAGKNIRSTFDDEKLQELAESIKQRGVLHPIICRRSNGKLELIAGERRLRASKIAGLTHIPALMRDTGDEELTYDRIVENLQREDLSDDDQFNALKALREKGLAVPRISKMTGLSTTTIQRVLALESLKASIRERDDVSSYAKAFIARAPREVQDLLTERIAEGHITSKQLGHDVMPAITEAMDEKVFSPEEKKQVVRKIVQESGSDRPARAILHQERGKKKLRKEGAGAAVASSQTLKEMLDLSQHYHERLLSFSVLRFDHLDPSLVIGLVDAFRQVQTTLTDILSGIRAGGNARRMIT